MAWLTKSTKGQFSSNASLGQWMPMLYRIRYLCNSIMQVPNDDSPSVIDMFTCVVLQEHNLHLGLPTAGSLPCHAAASESSQQQSAAPSKVPPRDQQFQSVQKQQQQHQFLPQPGWAAWLGQQWQRLDLSQRVYTVVVSLVLLAALPKLVTLLVLMLERVLIGGLLSLEELLLNVLLRGGAVVSWHCASWDGASCLQLPPTAASTRC